MAGSLSPLYPFRPRRFSPGKPVLEAHDNPDQRREKLGAYGDQEDYPWIGAETGGIIAQLNYPGEYQYSDDMNDKHDAQRDGDEFEPSQ